VFCNKTYRGPGDCSKSIAMTALNVQTDITFTHPATWSDVGIVEEKW